MTFDAFIVTNSCLGPIRIHAKIKEVPEALRLKDHEMAERNLYGEFCFGFWEKRRRAVTKSGS